MDLTLSSEDRDQDKETENAILRNPSKKQTLHGKIIYRAKLCDFKEVFL